MLLAITAAVLVALIGSPSTTQSFVENSGAYDSIINRILDESAKLDDSENTVPVNDPKIRKLANDTFPPERLKELFKDISDGTYRWLNGEVPKPDYVLNLADEKREIAKGVSQYAKQRVQGLPMCSSLPTTTDPFELDCQPPGINLDAEAQKIERELLASDGFLPDTTITFDDIGDVQQQDLDRISDSFQRLQTLPLTMAVLAVISSIAIVFLAKSKRIGLDRVAKSLLSTGLFLAISALVFGKLLPALSPNLKAQFKDGSFANILNNIVFQAIDLAVQRTLIYSGAVILIAILLFIVLRLTRNRQNIIRPQVNPK